MLTRSLTLILIILCLASALSAHVSKQRLRVATTPQFERIEEPPLYLPSAKYVKFATLGYDNFVSHIIWFNTQSYFGKHYKSDKDYRWLQDMCNVVTDLNPNTHHTFEFCAMMLAWSAQDPSASNSILSKAISIHPQKWLYWYLRGFNSFYFLGNKQEAKEDLIAASKLPNAPVQMLSSIAARLMVSEQDTTSAITFLKSIIQNTQDETVKSALAERLKQAYLTNHIQFLTSMVNRFETMHGRKPTDIEELISSGLITQLPQEPFGGHYILDKNTGHIKSSSGKSELKFSLNTQKNNHSLEK